MAHVIVLDSLNEDIFVCGQCKCVFTSLNVFLHHKSVKCSELVLEPEQDSNTTSLIDNTVIKTTFPSHEITTQKESLCENNISCKVCRKEIKNSERLTSHMKTHIEKYYQCPVCGRCFSQNSHLQRHIATHKVWPEGLTETTPKSIEIELLSYTCLYCSKTVPNYNQYRLHLKNHLDLKKYKCMQYGCTSFHESMESLLEHISANHNPPIYECHMCSSTFNSLESVAIHQQNHSKLDARNTNSKRYKCSLCDAVFKKSEKLTLHLLTENHKKVCIHCNKTFASDKRLRLHLQVHRKMKIFQCNVCPSSFHMKKYLTSHMLKHGKREFQCTVCQVMFKRRDLLQRHMRVHQMKLFQCPFKETLNCKREFSRSDKLKLHLKCHSNSSLNSVENEQGNKII